MHKTILTTLLFVSVSAFAQDSGTTITPPSPAQIVAHQVAHVTRLLTLTASQQTQATAIFTTAETALLPLRASLRTAHTALKTAIEANDSATIATQTTEIGTLSGQEQLARSTAEAAFYQILTPTQQTSYAEELTHGRGDQGRLAGRRGH
jgi:Spy/CpxP family protein refolding chaperone